VVPPVILSLPAPPTSRSLPPPPVMVSFPALPNQIRAEAAGQSVVGAVGHLD
jgi:hypothetical protein